MGSMVDEIPSLSQTMKFQAYLSQTLHLKAWHSEAAYPDADEANLAPLYPADVKNTDLWMALGGEGL